MQTEGFLRDVGIIHGGAKVDDHVLRHVVEADRRASRILYDVCHLVLQLTLPLVCTRLGGSHLGGHSPQIQGGCRHVHIIAIEDDRAGDCPAKINATTDVGNGKADFRGQDDRDAGTDINRERSEIRERHAHFQTTHTWDVDFAVQSHVKHPAGYGCVCWITAGDEIVALIVFQESCDQLALHVHTTQSGFHSDVK